MVKNLANLIKVNYETKDIIKTITTDDFFIV